MSPVCLMFLPASASRQTVMPFTPAAAKFLADSSMAQGFVVMVWMQSLDRSVIGLGLI